MMWKLRDIFKSLGITWMETADDGDKPILHEGIITQFDNKKGAVTATSAYTGDLEDLQDVYSAVAPTLSIKSCTNCDNFTEESLDKRTRPPICQECWASDEKYVAGGINGGRYNYPSKSKHIWEDPKTEPHYDWLMFRGNCPAKNNDYEEHYTTCFINKKPCRIENCTLSYWSSNA